MFGVSEGQGKMTGRPDSCHTGTDTVLKHEQEEQC